MPPNKQETACGRHAGSAFEINDQKRAACPQRPEAQLPAFFVPSRQRILHSCGSESAAQLLDKSVPHPGSADRLSICSVKTDPWKNRRPVPAFVPFPSDRQGAGGKATGRPREGRGKAAAVNCGATFDKYLKFSRVNNKKVSVFPPGSAPLLHETFVTGYFSFCKLKKIRNILHSKN